MSVCVVDCCIVVANLAKSTAGNQEQSNFFHLLFFLIMTDEISNRWKQRQPAELPVATFALPSCCCSDNDSKSTLLSRDLTRSKGATDQTFQGKRVKSRVLQTRRRLPNLIELLIHFNRSIRTCRHVNGNVFRICSTFEVSQRHTHTRQLVGHLARWWGKEVAPRNGSTKERRGRH